MVLVANVFSGTLLVAHNGSSSNNPIFNPISRSKVPFLIALKQPKQKGKKTPCAKPPLKTGRCGLVEAQA